MLVDRYRQLLTAYVDGELSSRQRRHVGRLLHRSPEARQLLQQLQEDARSLRHLPRPHLPIDLTGEVLRTIVERRLTPGQRRIAKARWSTSWVGPIAAWATAAAVLIVLGAASYLYFAASLAHSLKADLAHKDSVTPAPASAPEKPGSSVVAKSGEPAHPSEQKHPHNPDNPSVKAPPEVVKRPSDKPPAASVETPAPSKDDAVLTDRLEMFRLREVQAVLPVILKVHELDQQAVRKSLIAELGKDVNHRLELPCKNGTKAFEHIQSAAKGMNVGLVIDRRAQDRLKLPTWKTNYVVYIENLTPEALAEFVQRVGVEDKKRATHKPAERQFDRLVLTRMTPEHHKELSSLMGVDPTASEPAAKGPLGTDPRKPLSELTALQVGQSLAGQGGTPRPEAGKRVVTPAHLALVLAYNPVRPYPGSVEIKRFLDSRKPAKEGTVRVLLVLRG